MVVGGWLWWWLVEIENSLGGGGGCTQIYFNLQRPARPLIFTKAMDSVGASG